MTSDEDFLGPLVPLVPLVPADPPPAYDTPATQDSLERPLTWRQRSWLWLGVFTWSQYLVMVLLYVIGLILVISGQMLLDDNCADDGQWDCRVIAACNSCTGAAPSNCVGPAWTDIHDTCTSQQAWDSYRAQHKERRATIVLLIACLFLFISQCLFQSSITRIAAVFLNVLWGSIWLGIGLTALATGEKSSANLLWVFTVQVVLSGALGGGGIICDWLMWHRRVSNDDYAEANADNPFIMEQLGLNPAWRHPLYHFPHVVLFRPLNEFQS